MWTRGLADPSCFEPDVQIGDNGDDHFYALVYERLWDTLLPALERVSDTACFVCARQCRQVVPREHTFGCCYSLGRFGSCFWYRPRANSDFAAVVEMEGGGSGVVKPFRVFTCKAYSCNASDLLLPEPKIFPVFHGRRRYLASLGSFSHSIPRNMTVSASPRLKLPPCLFLLTTGLSQVWQSDPDLPRGAVTSFDYCRDEVDTVLRDYRDPTGRILRTQTQMFKRYVRV